MTTAETAAPVQTVKAYLRPIDAQGLAAFAEKGRGNPASRGTNKVHTIMEGQYRSLSYVGNHAAVVVDEPLHLFGQDTAPAPGEIVWRDDLGVTCRAWNWRQGVRTRITESSTHIYFLLEAIEEEGADSLGQAADKLGERLDADHIERVQLPQVPHDS